MLLASCSPASLGHDNVHEPIVPVLGQLMAAVAEVLAKSVYLVVECLFCGGLSW